MARKRPELENWAAPELKVVCPLCSREIPPSEYSRHHFVPKSKGGKETQVLHRVCHRQIHALFTEQELAVHYNTPAALLEHEEVVKFVKWVAKKPIDFYERAKTSSRKR